MVIIDNLVLLSEFKNLVSNVYIQIFVWIVIADIITGVCKGLAGKETNSTKGLMGGSKAFAGRGACADYPTFSFFW